MFKKCLRSQITLLECMKTIICDKKNQLNETGGRLGIVKEKELSKLENTAIETIKYEIQLKIIR